jgi:hypothetical protein
MDDPGEAQRVQPRSACVSGSNEERVTGQVIHPRGA